MCAFRGLEHSLHAHAELLAVLSRSELVLTQTATFFSLWLKTNLKWTLTISLTAF